MIANLIGQQASWGLVVLTIVLIWMLKSRDRRHESRLLALAFILVERDVLSFKDIESIGLLETSPAESVLDVVEKLI